jgi:uncharacterized protein
MSHLYQSSVPAFTHLLSALSKILDRAKAFADEKKFDETVLLNARLAPDMFPFSRQVQVSCDFAKGCGARLAGVDILKFDDTEKTLDELKARIQKTIEFLHGIEKSKFDGAENRDVTVRVSGEEKQVNAAIYARDIAMPNFYFHLTTSYAILRHNGVAIGKNDFLGRS